MKQLLSLLFCLTLVFSCQEETNNKEENQDSQEYVIIQAGERGVVFYTFADGLDKENIYKPGKHLIAPWDQMIIYNIKDHTINEKFQGLSQEGVSYSIELSVIFAPQPEMIGYLHEEYGEQYIERLVDPELRRSMRIVMGDYTLEEIYNTDRKIVEKQIIDELNKLENYFKIKEVKINEIILPESFLKFLLEKQEQLKRLQRMEFLRDSLDYVDEV